MTTMSVEDVVWSDERGRRDDEGSKNNRLCKIHFERVEDLNKEGMTEFLG